MQLSGWVPMHRDHFDKYFKGAGLEFYFYTWLLMHAALEPTEVWVNNKTKVEVGRGEILTSVRDVTKWMRLHHRTLRRICENLLSKGLIEIKSKEPFLLRVCQFDHVTNVKKKGKRVKKVPPQYTKNGIERGQIDTPETTIDDSLPYSSLENEKENKNENRTKVLFPTPSTPGDELAAILHDPFPPALPGTGDDEGLLVTDKGNLLVRDREATVAPPKPATIRNSLLAGVGIINVQNSDKSPAKGRKKKAPKEPAKSMLIFRAYAESYSIAWPKNKPVPFNAEQASAAKRLLEKVGLEDGIQIARAYPFYKDSYWLQQGHPLRFAAKEYMRILRDLSSGIKMYRADALHAELEDRNRVVLEKLDRESISDSELVESFYGKS